MKRATIGGCKLEILYDGDGEGGGFTIEDPASVWLMLPDGDLFKLTGDCGDDIKAHIWVGGGWLYKAEKIEEVDDANTNHSFCHYPGIR